MEISGKRILGTNVSIHAEHVPGEIIVNTKKLDSLLEDICTVVHATVVNRTMHEYDNHGYTSVFILAESSIILHTWPEYNALTIDLFMCSDNIDNTRLESVIRKTLKTDQCRFESASRWINETQ